MMTKKIKKVFIGDTHFGHENLLRFRSQFDTINPHDDFIRDNIIMSVDSRTDLYLVGDVCFTKETFITHILPLKENVRKVILIPGNHDFERSKAPKIQDFLDAGIIIRPYYSFGEYFVSHVPVHQSQFEREGVNKNICAHTHGEYLLDERYICVSCEVVNYTPVEIQ